MESELWTIAKETIGGLLALAVAVGSWLWCRVVSDVRDLEDDMHASKLDLSEFKLHVAENHPTKNDIVAEANQNRETLSRLHDRIDVVSEDVKTLIGMVGKK